MVAPEGIPRRGFTPKFIETLPARERSYELADPSTPGLRLRVHPTGAKTFRWYVTSLGRVVTLGPWSLAEQPAFVTLAGARRWLERLKAARAAGVEQLDAVEAELRTYLAPRPAAAATEAVTVNAVAARFLKLMAQQRKRPKEVEYTLNKDVLPVIGALPLRSLKKSDCVVVVERVVERDAAGRAGKVLALMKQLLDYAENVEDDFVNPAARLKASNLGVVTGIRTRWLTEKEIPTFWAALERSGAPESEKDRRRTRAALRLLLLTAVRTAELRLARWAHVDLDGGTWTIPVENQKLTLKQAKLAKPFVIPLTATAAEQLEQLQELAGESPWVLASADGELGPYTENALGRAMRRLWRSHEELKKLPEASPHDLRRTARTWLGKLGAPPHIAERCLNHKLGKLIATYDQGDYIEERRAALEKWDAWLLRTVSPEASNVTFLPAAG